VVVEVLRRSYNVMCKIEDDKINEIAKLALL